MAKSHLKSLSLDAFKSNDLLQAGLDHVASLFKGTEMHQVIQKIVSEASIGDRIRLSSLKGNDEYDQGSGRYKAAVPLYSKAARAALAGSGNSAYAFAERYEYYKEALKNDSKGLSVQSWESFVSQVEKSIAEEMAIANSLAGKAVLQEVSRKNHPNGSLEVHHTLSAKNLLFGTPMSLLYHVKKHYIQDLVTKSKAIENEALRRALGKILTGDTSDFNVSATEYTLAARALIEYGHLDQGIAAFDQSGRRQLRFEAVKWEQKGLAVFVKIDPDNKAYIATMY